MPGCSRIQSCSRWCRQSATLNEHSVAAGWHPVTWFQECQGTHSFRRWKAWTDIGCKASQRPASGAATWRPAGSKWAWTKSPPLRGPPMAARAISPFLCADSS